MKLLHNGLPAAAVRAPETPDPGDAGALRAFLDTQGVGILIEDRSATALYANPALAALLGVDAPDTLCHGGGLLDHLDDAGRACWLALARERHATGGARRQELTVRVRRADGEERVLHAVMTPVHWEGDRAAQAVLVDVTRHTRQQSQLENAEQRWRALLEGSIQGVLVHRDNRLLFANETAARLFGYPSVRDLLAVGDGMALVAPHDRERLRAYGDLRLSGGDAPQHYEFDAITADGRIIHVENAARAVSWDGKPAIQSTMVDVTERRRAEAVLRENEARYRMLAETGSEWIWETDARHRVVHLSRSGEPGARRLPQRGIGLTREELIDWDATDAVAARRHLDDLAAGRPFRDFVYRLAPRLTGGAEVWVRVSGTPHHDAHGRFLGYRGCGTDVTEEVTARERARTAEQHLAQALQSIPDGFVLYDAHDRLVICNGAYREMFPPDMRAHVVPGVSFEALLRAGAERGCYADAVGREEEWLARRLADFHRGDGLQEVARSDGRWHRIRDQRLPDGSTVVVCSEITEIKEREAALRASEKRFRDYLASSSDWFWECDAEHRFTFLSARFTELTGVPTERFIGRYRGEIAPDGAGAETWQRHLDDLRAQRAFRGLRYAMPDGDGRTRHYEVSGVPFYDEDGTFLGFRGTGLDCTAEMQARLARERYQEAIDGLTDGYALFDADDRLLAWNSAWEAFAAPLGAPPPEPGMSLEQTLGRHLARGLCPATARDRQTSNAGHRRRTRDYCEPFEIRRGAGRWFQIRERRTPEGGALITVSDVSELKQREQALQSSEERFKDFAETAADWFFETDDELRFTSVSDRFESLTGIPPETLAGSDFSAILMPGERLTGAMLARETLENVECEGLARNGDGVVHSISARAVYDAAGAFVGYRGSGRDVTQARRMSRLLSFQASHDDLTGLVNRREFERRLARAVASAQDGTAVHALCYMDLDQFKVLNDTCGHSAGDDLLRRLGGLLKHQVRARDTLARLGGDEFALLLEHCSLDQAAAVAESVRAAVEGFEFAWDGKPFRLGASIGLVPIDGSHADGSEALRAADNACYLAKDRGRNRVHVYTPQDAGIAHREGEMHWVARITGALAQDRFVLVAQPIVAARDHARTSRAPRHELLLRMRDDDGSLVPPGAFLPAAERYGCANRVDRWVVDHALGFLDAHQDRIQPGARLSVNLSGQSLNDPEFLDYLSDRLSRRTGTAGRLCFEVTETATIANLEAARDFLGVLRGQGCEVALDDFGTGLSSFAYLRDLPIDYLKIDGAFVRGVEDDPVSMSIVRSINDIGQVLGKRTIAEYVENERVASLLAEIGVDFLQGFGVGMPVPLDALVE